MLTARTINASDLTLNCAGFTVTYGSGDSSGTHGINNNGGFDNITIKNCIIKKGSSTEFSAGNYGIYFSSSTENVTSINNTISTNGTTNNHGINLDTQSIGNYFRNNNITTHGTSGAGVSLSSSANNSFFNTLFNYPISWIESGASSVANFTNTTFSALNGSIRFINNFTISSTFSVTRTNLNITYNKSYINSTLFAFLNTSAEITLLGINYSDPEPTVAFGDSASFATCNSPQCNEVNYSNGVFVFNVSSFTTYSSRQVSNVAPNAPNVAINSTDGSNVSSQDLNCFTTLIDADNNTMNVSVNWYRNSTLNLSVDYNNSYANGTAFNAVLGNGNLTGGYYWFCSVRLYDGQAYSGWGNSSNLSVLNPPSGNATSCGPISSNITLSTSVTSNSTCYTINADNVSLDCAGYSIFYNLNGSSGSNGIGAKGVNNLTIKNCIIQDINSSGSYGIAINLTNVNLSLISSNSIYTNGTNDSYGIYLLSGSGNTINSTNISSLGSGNRNYGIFLNLSLNNTISSNNISTNGTSNNNGIYLENSANENQLVGNNILTSGADSYGVYISSSINNIFNRTILLNPSQWINSSSSSPNNFTNTTFSALNGSINIISNVQINGTYDITKTKLNISLNRVFLNSTNLTALNTSAWITLFGVSLTDPEPTFDSSDSGSYASCPALRCTEISYNSITRVFVFSVSSFSAYSSQETPVSPPPSGGGGGCSDVSWTCGGWSNCIGQLRSRTCTSNCGNLRTESEACACTPDWSCTAFGSCESGFRNRVCTDLNNCGNNNGKPDESEQCALNETGSNATAGGVVGGGGGGANVCIPDYSCGDWNQCVYDSDAGKIIQGMITKSGLKDRTCSDKNKCAPNYIEQASCNSSLQIAIRKESVCDTNTLTLLEKTKMAPITSINLESWKTKKLDVAFVQEESIYCPDCYNGIKDGNEEEIDCGGSCRACLPESTFPDNLSWITGVLIVLSLLLIIPIFKILREDYILVSNIRELIKSGEESLKFGNREKAENNFRKIKWNYIQIGSRRIRKKILREIGVYHRGIRDFSEF